MYRNMHYTGNLNQNKHIYIYILIMSTFAWIRNENVLDTNRMECTIKTYIQVMLLIFHKNK